MNGASTTRWLIVGVDGSDSSRHALEWSAHQAMLRGLGVLIVAAARPLATNGFGWWPETEQRTEEAEGSGARRLLEHAHDWVARLFPELSVRTRLSFDRAMATVPFGALPIGSVRTSHVEAWVQSQVTNGLAASTIGVRFQQVRSVFRAAIGTR